MEELFGNSVPSIIGDPFKKECIESIRMSATKSLLREQWCFRGSVEFKNGQTEGTQNFEEESLDKLYMKIAEFCKKLE